MPFHDWVDEYCSPGANVFGISIALHKRLLGPTTEPSGVVTSNLKKPQPSPPIVCGRPLRLKTVMSTVTVSPARNDARETLVVTSKAVVGAVMSRLHAESSSTP